MIGPMQARVQARLLAVVLVVAGCGSRSLTLAKDARPATDLPAADLPATDFRVASGADAGLADFCTGNSSRMIVNGLVAEATVEPQAIVMDCCDGAALVVTSSDFDQPI
jgi:hypothetical protein